MNIEYGKSQSQAWTAEPLDGTACNDADFIQKHLAHFEKSQRILVVDDEPDIVDEMSSFLENKGHSCEIAFSATEALERLVSVPEISIVLTDIRMPGMSGLDLLGALRQPPYMDRQIEVVVLTGHAGRDEAIQALHNGAIDFLVKPVSLKAIQISVSRALEVLRTRFMEALTRQKLAETLEEERRTNLIQREFVAMVSHEFRTPLAIIDGAAQRLNRRKDVLSGGEIEERVGRIRTAVTRMTDLISDTLCASRLDAGHIKFAPTACRFVELIRTVCQTQQDLNTGHRVTFDPGQLPEVMVADSNLLELVVGNLVMNAIKYSPEGKCVEIVGGVDGNFATLTVRDNGIGIPPQDIPHLFDRYYRASNTTGIPGTGIGLFLVKRLIEVHDGSIEVESIEGKGSAITIWISGTITAAPPTEAEEHSGDKRGVIERGDTR